MRIFIMADLLLTLKVKYKSITYYGKNRYRSGLIWILPWFFFGFFVFAFGFFFLVCFFFFANSIMNWDNSTCIKTVTVFAWKISPSVKWKHTEIKNRLSPKSFSPKIQVFFQQYDFFVSKFSEKCDFRDS